MRLILQLALIILPKYKNDKKDYCSTKNEAKCAKRAIKLEESSSRGSAAHKVHKITKLQQPNTRNFLNKMAPGAESIMHCKILFLL